MGSDAPEKPSEGSSAPEVVKTATWAYEGALQYWRLYVQPPVLVLIVVVGALAYHYGTSVGDDRLQSKTDLVTTKQAQVEFLTSQVGAYKDRLNGATPDEAAKRISGLEAKIEQQADRLDTLLPKNYRHLTADQKGFLQNNIDKIKEALPKDSFIAISAEPIGDSPNYGNEIANFLNGLSKDLVQGTYNGTCGENERGLTFDVKEVSKPAASSVALFAIFSQAGLQPHYYKAGPNVEEPNIFVCRLK